MILIQESIIQRLLNSYDKNTISTFFVNQNVLETTIAIYSRELLQYWYQMAMWNQLSTNSLQKLIRQSEDQYPIQKIPVFEYEKKYFINFNTLKEINQYL